MTLKEKQFTFAALLPHLIDKALVLGYEVTLGEAWRPPEMALIYAKRGQGIAHSLHELRLAVDLNLFKRGQLTNEKSDYAALGEYWKMLSSLDYECVWGGDFTSLCDIYHFSIAHNGTR